MLKFYSNVGHFSRDRRYKTILQSLIFSISQKLKESRQVVTFAKFSSEFVKRPNGAPPDEIDVSYVFFFLFFPSRLLCLLSLCFLQQFFVTVFVFFSFLFVIVIVEVVLVFAVLLYVGCWVLLTLLFIGKGLFSNIFKKTFFAFFLRSI